MNGPNLINEDLSWSWEGPSTVSQLKESMRLNFRDLVFLCETKQNKGFMETVCKRLKFGIRWEVSEPIGRKGSVMVAWTRNVEVKHI